MVRPLSIKSENSNKTKCSFIKYDVCTHTCTHTYVYTHTHMHSQVHVCTHANTAPVISEAGLPQQRHLGELSELGVSQAVGLGLSRHAQTQPLPLPSCGKVLLSAIRGRTQGWAVGQADSPTFRTPLFALDLGMKQRGDGMSRAPLPLMPCYKPRPSVA